MDSTARTSRAPSALLALCALARCHQIAAGPPLLLLHQLGLAPSDAIDIATLLRAARQLGLKAKSSRTTPERLSLTLLPALAMLRKRRIIELLLSPVQRATSENMRER